MSIFTIEEIGIDSAGQVCDESVIAVFSDFDGAFEHYVERKAEGDLDGDLDHRHGAVKVELQLVEYEDEADEEGEILQWCVIAE